MFHRLLQLGGPLNLSSSTIHTDGYVPLKYAPPTRANMNTIQHQSGSGCEVGIQCTPRRCVSPNTTTRVGVLGGYFSPRSVEVLRESRDRLEVEGEISIEFLRVSRFFAREIFTRRFIHLLILFPPVWGEMCTVGKYLRVLLRGTFC